MGDSRSRKQAQFQDRIGKDAKVKLVPTPHAESPFAYRVKCLICPPSANRFSKGPRSSTHQTFIRSLEAWTKHVTGCHIPERLTEAWAEHELLQAERDAHQERTWREVWDTPQSPNFPPKPPPDYQPEPIAAEVVAVIDEIMKRRTGPELRVV